MNRDTLAYAVLSALALAGCATAPVGPNVVVMPAPNKPLEVFEQDDAYCRDYANRAISGQAQRAENAAVGKAVAGTVIGAAAGAALGGRDGAAVGAGGGLVVGSAVGADSGGLSSRQLQRRYDIAYLQCMYSKGNQIPGQYLRRGTAVAMPPPPPPPNTQQRLPPPPPPQKE